MSAIGRLALALVLAVVAASGCSVFEGPDPWCPPVDPGGDCFVPSEAEFVAHALESSAAWPQLHGTPLTAGPVIESFDEATGLQAWVVPLFHRDQAVAASRFHPFQGHAKLAEVALYPAPRSAFPIPGAGERLVLFEMTCTDPWPDACLFQNSGWRIE